MEMLYNTENLYDGHRGKIRPIPRYMNDINQHTNYYFIGSLVQFKNFKLCLDIIFNSHVTLMHRVLNHGPSLCYNTIYTHKAYKHITKAKSLSLMCAPHARRPISLSW